MRWAGLFLVLAGVTLVAYLIQGAVTYNGLSLLTFAFLVAAALAGLLTRSVDRSVQRKRQR